MEERFQDRVTVEEVIHDLPVSRRNFIRRFKSATGITPIEYLQRIRIEAAKKLLEEKQDNITGVMIQAGYEDAKAFRQLFRKIVGLSPKNTAKSTRVNPDPLTLNLFTCKPDSEEPGWGCFVKFFAY